MRHSFATALFVLASAALAVGGAAPAAAEDKPAGTIRIEYVPPKNPEHQALYALVQERHALEKVQNVFGALRLPMDLKVRTIGCDGVSNAWYQPIDNVPTVTLCYEYLYEIWKTLPVATTEGITRIDAVAGQFFFAVAHEFGHLVFDVYDVPIFAHQEDAADAFATYVMLQFREDAPRLISGAAWSYYQFIKDFREHPKATLPLAAFSSNHGQPEERFFNLLCIAYGSDQKLYAGMVEKGYLPQSRAKDCKYEFGDLQRAFRQQIAPHIDKERAAKVLATGWLTGVVEPPRLR